MRKTLAAISVLLLTSGAAFAGHGKAGLWNVTTSMTMPNMPQMPPEAMAMMKQRGMKMPGMGGPVTSKICMTQADVDSDVAPRMGDHDENCQTHVTAKTGSSVSADLTCSGRMQGTGHLQVSYSDASIIPAATTSKAPRKAVPPT